MNTHLLALQLMALQGILGAFDTLYHHELTEALAQRRSAARELGIHALRALIYAALFIGLSAWEWHGAWAAVLIFVFGIEIVLTLWDFMVEDRTRLLPATERVMHTVLAINGGAFITLLALNFPAWWSEPTGFAWEPHGLLSAFLALAGIGVGLSGMRDAFAARRLRRRADRDDQTPPVHFNDEAAHVLLTGATGFIGQRLVRALLADGHQLTILTRNPRATAWLFEGRVRCMENMRELPRTQRVDVIINLAGARILGWRWTAKRQEVLRKSRIDLTRSVVEWIGSASHKPKLLLSASAIGYYGIQDHDDDAVLTETSPPQSIFMSRLCHDWELEARAAAVHGVRVACLRLGVVFGDQGALPMMMLPIKLGLGGSMGSGRQCLSWIHIDDVLRAIAHAWQAMSDGSEADVRIYNLTAPESVTQRQFSRVAAKVVGRPCFFPTPAFPMRLMLGEQADLLLEGQRVAPLRLQTEKFKFIYPDLRSALESMS